MDISSPYHTMAIDDTDFYLASHSFNKPSQLYAYALWAMVFLLICTTKIRLPNRLRRQVAPFLRWTIVKNPTGARIANTASPDFLPSNGNILFIATFFILLCSLCSLGPDYIPGQGFQVNAPAVQKVVLKSLWTSAARAGLIAFCLLPLTVLLGLKSSPASVFTWRLTARMYFDKLAVFHRWTARFLYFFAALHVVLWTAKLSMDTVHGGVALRKAFGNQRFVCGWVAFGTFTLLMVSSSTALRKVHYETFYALHVFLFPVMLIMGALHHPETSWWAWVALLLWLVERAWRSGRIMRHNCEWPLSFAERGPSVSGPVADDNEFLEKQYRPPPGYAHAELLSGATIRLTYSPVRRIRWAAGQHFLLTIPAISRFTSHPFTCATVSPGTNTHSGQAEMQFLIRAKAGWTRNLWDMVVSHAAQMKSYYGAKPPSLGMVVPPSGLVLKLLVDGPFGSSIRVPWKDHSSILIIVGGSGVTFGLPVLKHICHTLAAAGRQDSDTEKGGYSVTKLQRIRFVWLVREFDHIQWCASIIRECKSMLSKHQLWVDIFVTNTKIHPPPTSIDKKSPTSFLGNTDMGEPPLLPPLPAFYTLGRNPSAPIGIPNESVDSLRSDVGSQVSVGHVPNHPFLQSRDLTDFEGDSGIILPGEISLSRRVDREGRARRKSTRKGKASRTSTGSWDMVLSPLSQSSSGHCGSKELGRELENVSPSILPTSGHLRLKRERRIASGSSSGSSSTSSPGHQSPISWLPLHSASGKPPRVFAQAELVPEKGGADSPVRVRLDARELKDIAIVGEDTKAGKPKLARILEHELAEAVGSILVTCCGPVSLDALVRKTIADRMREEGRKKDGKIITYYSEDFSY